MPDDPRSPGTLCRWLAAAALVAVAGACGSDDDSDGASPPASTTTTTSAPAELPGERVEIFPYEGARMAVVGVPAGDTLPVRDRPSPEAGVVAELPPTDMGATATGHNRSVGDTFWSEITVDGRRGWAESSFLLQPGQVDDVTARMFPTPADRPSAPTMEELGRAVAGRRASTDPPSRIVVVAGPTVGDLGEVSIDVLGFGDDSVGGERLTVFAEPGAGGETFTVRTVEAQTFCSRGVTDDGLCV